MPKLPANVPFPGRNEEKRLCQLFLRSAGSSQYSWTSRKMRIDSAIKKASKMLSQLEKGSDITAATRHTYFENGLHCNDLVPAMNITLSGQNIAGEAVEEKWVIEMHFFEPFSGRVGAHAA